MAVDMDTVPPDLEMMFDPDALKVPDGCVSSEGGMPISGDLSALVHQFVEEKIQTTMLTGMMIGALVAILLVIIIIFFIYRRMKQSRDDASMHCICRQIYHMPTCDRAVRRYSCLTPSC
uniref:Patatin like phospholipase domain containing 7 2 isoform 4 n=1 Tax=Potamotrygon motoro TaxID=86373 RepID=A0A5J6SDN5_POTMO|nr:patatin like phospholipase domain containing 7 2 isoform 4 [Potamotrygon motoro]